MRETEIQNRIMAAIGALPGVLLMRNAQNYAQIFDEKTGRERHTKGGLGKGSSDLVLVLAPAGRFVALEVKNERGVSNPATRAAQETWARVVRSFGGFYAIVRSPEDAIAAIERARAGASE